MTKERKRKLNYYFENSQNNENEIKKIPKKTITASSVYYIEKQREIVIVENESVFSNFEIIKEFNNFPPRLLKHSTLLSTFKGEDGFLPNPLKMTNDLDRITELNVSYVGQIRPRWKEIADNQLKLIVTGFAFLYEKIPHPLGFSSEQKPLYLDLSLIFQNEEILHEIQNDKK